MVAKVQIKRKVDFDIFVWVISILGGALITVAGYVFSEIASLRAAQEKTVATVEGYIKEVNVRIDAGQDARQVMREMIVRLQTEVDNMKERELQRR